MSISFQSSSKLNFYTLKFSEKNISYLSSYLNYVSKQPDDKESFFWKKVSNDFSTAYMNCSIEKGFFSKSYVIYGKLGSIFILGYVFLEGVQRSKIMGSSQNARSGEYLISLLKKGLKDGNSLNPTLFGEHFDSVVFTNGSKKSLEYDEKLNFMSSLGDKHFHYEPI